MYWDDLTRKAFEIANKAHMGQVDKAGAPYILHPLAVAKEMPTSEMAAAALLHDVCEDTPVTLDNLREQGIPEIVVQAVKLLTHEPGLSYMKYIERLKNDEIASTVKRADLRHNCSPSRKTTPPTKKDEERLRRYQKALDVLIAACESEGRPTQSTSTGSLWAPSPPRRLTVWWPGTLPGRYASTQSSSLSTTSRC